MSMKHLAIMTSGGDSPGMNAAIRSIVRIACTKNWEVHGIIGGYRGLLNGNFEHLGPRSVSNIIHRGGTIIKAGRCPEFLEHENRLIAKKNLEDRQIEALIVVGGNGSFRGGIALGECWKGQIIGVPGTIDNDLYGTDYTIGYDTAINTAVDAIDKIRDTADAHERMFLIEVMGRKSGYIALDAGVAGGAEEILLPEVVTNLKALCTDLDEGKKKGKTSSILVVAEGNSDGPAYKVAEDLKQLTGLEYRVVVLGHLQRGGTPTARDRILASKLGAYAVQMIDENKTGVMVGEIGGKLVTISLKEACEEKKPLDQYLLSIASLLST